MFDGSRNEASEYEIDIADASFEAFRSFLSSFYTGCVTLTSANIAEIFYLTHKYDIESMFNGCSKYLLDSFTTNNSIMSLELAKRYQLEHLHIEFLERIRDNADAVFQTSHFLKCDSATLHAILQTDDDDDELDCDAESIFDACIRWAQQQCADKRIDPKCMKNIRMVLGDSFGLISFEKMNGKSFAERYRVWKELFTREEAEKILLHFCETPNKRARLAAVKKKA